MHEANLVHPQRQLAIRAALALEDQAVCRAVHRLHAKGALFDLEQVHVLAELLPMPRGLPEVRGIENRRLDLLVAARIVLAAPHVDERVPDDHALGVPKRPARRGIVEREEIELAAESAMVALLSLLDVMEVQFEVFLREERCAVDARQHRAGRVATPVGTGEMRQLEGLDRARVLQVGTAAEVREVVLRVRRQWLVDREIVDQLDLVLLVLIDEALTHRVAVDRRAFEGVLLLEDATHLVLEPHEVGLTNLLGKVEVVIEAVVDRRTNRDLDAREDVAGGFGQDMGCGVPQDRQCLFVTDAQDLDGYTVRQWQSQILDLAVDLDGGRDLRQALANRAGTVQTCRAVLEFEFRAVGEMDLHRQRLPSRLLTPRQIRVNDVIAWNWATRRSTSSRVRRCTRSVPNSSTLKDATTDP